MLKIRFRPMIALWLIVCFLPLYALADEGGVLSETELNQWMMAVLQETLTEQPLNAPVGEESRTEAGYAFMYSFATLYYDRPTLSEDSVLQSMVIYEPNQNLLRGIGVGTEQNALIQTYGWQNTIMMGDGIFAPFYVLDQLPEKAYWSWAMHEGDALLSVQCAIHVKIADDLYTDAGIKYTLEEGVVSKIEVYGLTNTITKAQAQSNLSAVREAQASGSGDGEEFHQQAQAQTPETAPYTLANTKTPFGENDLRFSSANFLYLSKDGATSLWGVPTDVQEVVDDQGVVLHTATRDGITLSFENDLLSTLSITSDAFEGPRGTRIGARLEEVVSLFSADGEGRVSRGAAILYGDGLSAPYGVMETLSDTGMQLRYVQDVVQNGDMRSVTLTFHFESNILTEILMYAW